MTAADALVIERLLPASPKDVFAAWTTPDRIAEWMSPVGNGEADVDLRVGGSFRVVMLGQDFRIEHTGEYVEVDPPRRLVFTWVSPYTGPEPSLVTVELVPRADGTLVTLTHRRLPADVLESHRGGWGSMLERLSDVVGTRSAR